MKIHHLNCATIAPLYVGKAAQQASPFTQYLELANQYLPKKIKTQKIDQLLEDLQKDLLLVCHCLLLETEQGLVLVDTGLGMGDIQNPDRLPKAFLKFFGFPKLDVQETAFAQVEALGFKPTDVKNIILTHLDLDHAGGIGDFPWATVHVLEDELKAATNPQGENEKNRYLPVQWEHNPMWKTHRYHGEMWRGLESIHKTLGISDVHLIPLPGHTRGHAAVAIEHGDGTADFFAADAYTHRDQALAESPKTHPTRWVYNQIMHVEKFDFELSLRKVRRLAKYHGDHVKIYCTHDPVEFAELKDGEA